MNARHHRRDEVGEGSGCKGLTRLGAGLQTRFLATCHMHFKSRTAPELRGQRVKGRDQRHSATADRARLSKLSQASGVHHETNRAVQWLNDPGAYITV